MMTDKCKGKPVKQMRIVFDDEDEADWNIADSKTWRYEKTVTRGSKPKGAVVAGKAAKAEKTRLVAKTHKAKPKVSKSK